MADNFDYVKFVSENKVGPYLQKEAKDGVDENDYFQRRGMGQLSAQIADRLEGLIDNRKLSIAMDTLGEIIDELQEEGFERQDILAYLRMQLKDYLG